MGSECLLVYETLPLRILKRWTVNMLLLRQTMAVDVDFHVFNVLTYHIYGAVENNILVL